MGVLAGYPLMDINIELLSYEKRDNESTAMAFKVAASNAIRQALLGATSKLLEPVFKLEVITPDDYMGGVISDLNSRRGKINGMNPKSEGVQIVNADVPLMNLFGYATDLRSASQGRASFSMEFLEYATLPEKLSQELLKKWGR